MKKKKIIEAVGDIEELKKIVKVRRYLIPPHGELIYKGEKKAIVTPKKYIVGNWNILVSGNLAYGFIRLSKPREIGLAQFKLLEKSHRISEEERKKRWPNIKTLFFYKVEGLIPLDKPMSEQPPKDVQVYYQGDPLKESDEFDVTRFEPEELKKLSNLDLVQRHEEIHRIFNERGSRRNDELVINAARFVVNELKNRSMEHRPEDLLDYLVEPVSETALANPTLKDCLEFWKEDFYLKDPFLALVGGQVVRGFGEDADVWMNWQDNDCSFCKRLIQILEFRLKEKLPPPLRNFPHLVPEPEGKFTNYIPLAKLKVEMIPQDQRELIQMSLLEQVPRAASPEIKKQAEISAKEDKVEMFRFFLPMKPTRAAKPNMRMTVDFFVSLFKDDDFPVLSSKKYDGMAIIIFKDGKKVEIWSEDGENIGDRLPTIVKQSAAMKDNFIVLAELEMWEGEKHLPREAIAGYVHAKTPPDDSGLVANVFTLLWFNGADLHDKGEDYRQAFLKKMNFPQSTDGVPGLKEKMNWVPHYLSKNTDELREHTEKVRWLPASEGNVAKKSKEKYHLDGRSRDAWIKFHNNALCFGLVIERIETKTKGVYNYRYGIFPGKHKVASKNLAEVKNEDMLEVGKTFNTDVKLERGDMLAVEFETLNFIHDEESDTISITAWAPRFIPLEKTEVKNPETADDVDKVVRRAEKEMILQRKRITKEGETIYEDLDDGIEYLSPEEYYQHAKESWNISKEEIDLFLSEEDSRLEESLQEEIRVLQEVLTPAKYKELEKLAKQKPLYTTILERHYRGKSAHADWRDKMNEHLEGWTLTDQPKGAIKESVDTVQEGIQVTKRVKWKFHPDMPAPVHIVAIKKAKQPLVWLVMNDKYLGSDAAFEPGTVGATKEFPGVFILEAEGMGWKGVTRPYFFEYFLDMPARFGMKDYLGRMIVRLIGTRPEWEKPPRGELQWQAKMTKEDIPYILSRRQRTRRDYVLKDEEKAIPPRWEKLIKPDFHWWVKGLSKKDKLERLDKAYNDLIDREILKGRKLEESSTATFAFRRRWWKGPEVVRAMPVDFWEVYIDRGKDYLDKISDMADNPLLSPEKGQTALRKKIRITPPSGKEYRDWLRLEKIEIPPNKPELGNPNKELVAYSDLVDKGEVTILQESPDFVSFEFKGKKLKGYWTLKREAPEAKIWIFRKSARPGEKKVEEEFPDEIRFRDGSSISLRNKCFPLSLDFGGKKYQMVHTGNNGLRLEASDG